jgi:hypothetical protein
LERRRHGRYLNRAEGVERAGEILSDRPGLDIFNPAIKSCTPDAVVDRLRVSPSKKLEELEWSALSRPVLPPGR